MGTLSVVPTVSSLCQFRHGCRKCRGMRRFKCPEDNQAGLSGRSFGGSFCRGRVPHNGALTLLVLSVFLQAPYLMNQFLCNSGPCWVWLATLQSLPQLSRTPRQDQAPTDKNRACQHSCSLQHPVLFSNLRKFGCGSVATSTQLQSWAWFQIKGNLVSFPRHRDKNRIDRNLKGSAEVPGLHLEKSTGSLVWMLSNTLFKHELSASTITSGICLYRFFRDSALKVMSYKKAILFLLLLIVLKISVFPGPLWPITWFLGFMRFR